MRRRLDSDRGFRYKGSDECPLVARLHLHVVGDLFGLVLGQALQRTQIVVAFVINQRGCVLLETDLLEFERDGFLAIVRRGEPAARILGSSVS